MINLFKKKKESQNRLCVECKYCIKVKENYSSSIVFTLIDREPFCAYPDFILNKVGYFLSTDYRKCKDVRTKECGLEGKYFTSK